MNNLIRFLTLLLSLLLVGVSLLAAQPLPDEDFRVIYLVSSNVEPTGIPSPEHIEKSFNAETVYTWQELLVADAEHPTEAIIIHQSAREMVDPVWLSETYVKRGVPVVGINFTKEGFESLFNEGCVTLNIGDDYDGDHYFIVSRQFYGDDPAEVERFAAGRAGACADWNFSGEYRKPIGTVGQGGGQSGNWLETKKQLKIFQHSLAIHVHPPMSE